MISFLQPDGVDAARSYTACWGIGSLGPEERLMLAVLEDAIVRFQKYAWARDGKNERLFREAEEWIMEGDEQWSFSFENLCEALRLDSRYIRRGLMLWKKERSLSASPKDVRRLVSRTRLNSCARVRNPRAS